MIPIDIIIANKNNAHFLSKCLESVFVQTLQPKEIIVVDDASTDDSRLVLESFVRRGKITLIQNNSNLGVAASRSRAIAQSKSAFLTTLDADDYYYDTRKLEMESALITGPHEHKVAFSDVMRVRENGEVMRLVSTKRRLREGDLSFHISHLNGFIPRDYLISRADYLAAGGYNQDLRIYEDWDLKIKIAKICSWHFSGGIGTAYRDNPKGLSKADRKEHISTMRRIFFANYPEYNSISRAVAFTRFFLYHSLYMGLPAI
jgi:glycosyltransferase involved in cell wall biosynthesis